MLPKFADLPRLTKGGNLLRRARRLAAKAAVWRNFGHLGNNVIVQNPQNSNEAKLSSCGLPRQCSITTPRFRLGRTLESHGAKGTATIPRCVLQGRSPSLPANPLGEALSRSKRDGSVRFPCIPWTDPDPCAHLSPGLPGRGSQRPRRAMTDKLVAANGVAPDSPSQPKFGVWNPTMSAQPEPGAWTPPLRVAAWDAALLRHVPDGG